MGKNFVIFNKKPNIRFLIFFIILLTLLAALAVSALNIFVLGDEAPVAEASYASGTRANINGWNPSGDQGRAYYYITLGGKRKLYNGSDRVNFNATLRLMGNAGALYRNGWLVFNQGVTFDTTSHNDHGGMGMSGTNFGWSTSWGSGDTTRRSGNVGPGAVSGAGKDYTVTLNFWADDSGKFWRPFKNVPYATDTHITPWVDVTARGDGTIPYVSAISGNNSTWSTQKNIVLTLTDGGAGVNPASIRINNKQVAGWTENGRTISNVRYTLKTAGTNNLKVVFADYLGNTRTQYYTIGYIDTASPYVVSQITKSTSAWTNQNVTLTATVRDTQSGIKSFTLAGNVATYAVNTTGNVTRSVAVGANTTYGGSFVDHVNKTGTLTNVTVSNIDKVIPVITNTYFDPKWVTGNVTLYIRATDSGGSGLNRVVVTPAGKPASNASAASGTVNGFTYTHKYTMAANYGKIQYTMTAYDGAGSASAKAYATPNIDTVAPVLGTPTLSGKLYNGSAVNAATTYSYSNITVTVPCSDVGSGIWKMTLNGVTLTQIGASSFTFTDNIKNNTINTSSYVITVYDQSGRTASTTIYPKKDSTTPGVSALGLNDWQKGGAQTVQASVWLGLSGGEVQMKRTYLGGADGKTVSSTTTSNWKTYAVGTSMYSGTTPVYQTLNHSVSQEGEEYYHFRIISGTGVATPWKGLSSANETAATMTQYGASWTFVSNGARTRIDNTAPQLTAVEYKNGDTTVLPSKFSDPNNYLAEYFDGHFSINDGIMAGSVRTAGLNGSGVVAWNTTNVRVIVTYADPLNGGAIVTHRDSDKTILDNAGFSTVYNSRQTIASFKNTFTNEGLPTDGRKRTLSYRIIVTDNVGNSSELTVAPYIDDVEPEIDIASAKELREGNEVDYSYYTPQNWTYNNIRFNLSKDFGPSGATVRWYINPNKGTEAPSPDSPLWSDDSNDGWGTIIDTSTSQTASVEIPKRSFDATIFFMIVSNAKKADGSLVVKRLAKAGKPIPKNFYIAVDRDKPQINYYEFTASNNDVIQKADWSPTNVKLTVYTKDDSAGGISGSGVSNVVVRIKGTGTTIPMTEVATNVWQSVNELVSNVYYIEIWDAVDQVSVGGAAYDTFAPNIDTKKPEMDVTANTYDAMKGGYGTGSYFEATPSTNQVTININSSGTPPTIKSGATLYYMKRDITSFKTTRYSLENEPNKTMISLPLDTGKWTQIATAGQGGQFSLIPVKVGASANSVEHYGYDFLIVSGSGHMCYKEYGTVFVDRAAPTLDLTQTEYIRDDGLPAIDLIPSPSNTDGKWTNAKVTARLHIKDIGSGVDTTQVRLLYQDPETGLDINLPPTKIEADGNGEGKYDFIFDSYINYEITYKDKAGNSGSYTVKPLIDIKQPTISLSATYGNGIAYNINAAAGNVNYIDKDVTIKVTLNYGVSAFTYDASSEEPPKDQMLYRLMYSTTGLKDDYINVAQSIGLDGTWTSGLGDVFTFNYHNRSSAQYEFKLSSDQNRAHYFEVWNGVPEENISQAEGANPTYGVPVGQDKKPYAAAVKIDKTAPQISSIDYSVDDINKWTPEEITVGFMLNDNLSGVLHDTIREGNYRRSVMLFKRLSGGAEMIGDKTQLTVSDGKYNFVMDEYCDYYIEYEDLVGNSGLYGPITPLIDKSKPEFVSVAATGGNAAYAQTWTFNDVVLTMKTSVSASGQQVQYQTRSNETALWGAWQTFADGTVDPKTTSKEKTTKNTFTKNSDTQLYKFRVISGAGLLSEYDYGWVRIDKTTPTIAVMAKANNVAYIQNEWTQYDVRFTINVTRGASGSMIEVSTEDSKALDRKWTNQTSAIGTVGNFGSDQGLLLVQNTTSNPLQYYFKVTSGAGLEAEYTRKEFMNGEWNDVPGFGFVKIDKVVPSITYSLGRISVEDATGEYPAMWEKKETMPPELGAWTYGYVMMKLTSNFGPSGAKLSYSDEVDGATGYAIFKDTATTPAQTTVNGWQFNGVDIRDKNVSGSNNVSYILLKEDQNRNYKLRITSNTGISSVIGEGDGNVMIDNTVPYMIANITSGNKSVKWSSSGVNDLHKWYTSAPTVTFEVGNLVENAVAGTYRFESGAPISGASVYFKYTYIDEEGNVIETDWDKNGVTKKSDTKFEYIVSHNALAVRTFEFKIVSGAGKELLLTEEYSQVENYDKKNLWIGNLTADDPGYYTIKVDTTNYKIDIQQWLKEYRDGLNNLQLPGVFTMKMAQMVLKVNGIEKTDDKLPEQKSLYTAKRGDLINVKITPNGYEESKGYGYIFKRSEYIGSELNASGDAYTEPQQYVLDLAAGMEFSFDIYDTDYSIKSYFTKEIDISYLDVYQIKQTQEQILPVSVTSDGKAVSELMFNILFTGNSYYPVLTSYSNSIVQPQEVGEYAIFISLANDNTADPNYKIHNPDTQSLRIVYFEDYSASVVPQYNINNATDLGYVNIYNDPETRFDFLGDRHTDAEYRQTADIELAADYLPIYGAFSGIYDGSNFELYAEEISADTVFGIFEAVNGTVKNLGVRLNRLTVSNAQSVGFIAGGAQEGAQIINCYAIGELIVSGEGNIGGLIGSANAAVLSNNYTDVAVSNKGAAVSGTIGGLVGLVENSKVMFGYAIGAIEVYGIYAAALKVGTLVGSLMSVAVGDNMFLGNKYLSGNLFVNDAVVSSSGAGYIDGGVSFGQYDLEGLLFNRFVDETSHNGTPDPVNIAATAIANANIKAKQIKTLALGRIADLGMTEGSGTAVDPFIVESQDALAFIDKYVWAHYVQRSNITLTGEFETIAAHKVFSGSYNGQISTYIDGEYVTITNSINNVVMNSTDKNTGMFGRVSGTIKNVDIRGLDIDITYSGSENAFAGGVAAILMPGARLEMVYVLGNITASAPNAVLRIGGIAGYADGATLIDLLSMANIKTSSTLSADAGGTVGYVKDSILRKIYSLARVEGSYTGTGSVGAIAGTMTGTTVANMVDYYAIIGNTYAHGQSYDYLAGYAPGTEIELGVDNANFMTFEQLRGSSLRFETDGNKEVDALLDEIYPLEGKGTLNNPFRVYTTADFAYINDFLYANYRIKSNLNFETGEFTTIGIGSKFTGTISAAMTNEEYNNAGGSGPRNYRITGMTNALVYHNAGTIRDIRLDISFNETRNTDTVIGTVAIYNSGTIQGVTAEGHIILRVTGSRMAIVGGFVGHDLGGTITQSETHSQDPSYELSSINGVILSVSGSQINAGGFVGRITGPTLLSYLISNGDLICNGGSVTAGTIAGAVLSTGMVFENEIDSNATVLVNGIDNTKQYGFYILH